MANRQKNASVRRSPVRFPPSSKRHPNSKTWLGGSKYYTGGTTSREFRRRRISRASIARNTASSISPKGRAHQDELDRVLAQTRSTFKLRKFESSASSTLRPFLAIMFCIRYT